METSANAFNAANEGSQAYSLTDCDILVNLITLYCCLQNSYLKSLLRKAARTIPQIHYYHLPHQQRRVTGSRRAKGAHTQSSLFCGIPSKEQRDAVCLSRPSYGRAYALNLLGWMSRLFLAEEPALGRQRVQFLAAIGKQALARTAHGFAGRDAREAPQSCRHTQPGYQFPRTPTITSPSRSSWASIWKRISGIHFLLKTRLPETFSVWSLTASTWTPT